MRGLSQPSHPSNPVTYFKTHPVAKHVSHSRPATRTAASFVSTLRQTTTTFLPSTRASVAPTPKLAQKYAPTLAESKAAAASVGAISTVSKSLFATTQATTLQPPSRISLSQLPPAVQYFALVLLIVGSVQYGYELYHRNTSISSVGDDRSQRLDAIFRDFAAAPGEARQERCFLHPLTISRTLFKITFEPFLALFFAAHSIMLYFTDRCRRIFWRCKRRRF